VTPIAARRGSINWRRAYFLALLVVIGVIVVMRMDSMGSGSVDVAHHYALAFRIAEQWQLLPGDPTLGEMNVYPRLSHILAAIIGALFQSTFLGIQLVVLVALALIWYGVVRLLGAVGGATAAVAVSVLAALALLNAVTLGLQMHGAELIGNFFYAQLVGQAGMMLALVAAVAVEPRYGRLPSYLVLVAAVAVLTSVHLLGALILLACLCVLCALDVLTQQGSARWRQLAPAVLCVGTALASVLFNPSFAAMRSIAENNGDLFMPFLPNRAAMLGLCALVLAGAVLTLRHWQRRRGQAGSTALKYLGALGAATALLCLVQVAVLYLKLGSDYAVKKYAFGLMTLLFTYVALGIGLLAARWRLAPTPPVALQYCLELAALAILFLTVSSWPTALDTSNVVAAERQIIALRNVAMAQPADGKANLIIDLHGQTRMVNYMFSIAIAHTPRDIAGTDLLLADDIVDFNRYTNIIASSQASRFSRAKCAANPGASMLVLDAGCLKEAVQHARTCSGTFDFSAAARLDPAMMRGFGDAEPTARWTAGKRAVFTCAAGGTAMAHLYLTPFLHELHKQQRLGVLVDGKPVAIADFKLGDSGRAIDFSLPRVAPGSKLEIALDIPDAIAPKALGLSGDERLLGFAVKSISFD